MNVCRVCGHKYHGSGIDYDAAGNKYVDPAECEEGGCPCEGDPGWIGGDGLSVTVAVDLPLAALYAAAERWLLQFWAVTSSEDKAWEWMEKAAADYAAAYYADAGGPTTLNEYRDRRLRQLIALPQV